ncbi:glycoside hydrolase family 36 protein [Inconstantimicrobium mannanitabidum]|uniref:Uncharacterized protein n=1 Tax=Inconstantimicrobium mannanitabidum TaxID=1604901 RepID=A0ACB5R8Y9_9CLOT|nr:glycoside hydrolase family 36 protein [Clostridium sp. TW13]GKX65334.1 hypothetical protein rsdtw13_05920 [Clostridium sp. TW13]
MRITLGKLAYKKINSTGKKVLTYDGNINNEDLSLEFSTKQENGGQHITITLLPKTELILKECTLRTDAKFTEETPIYLNGYQTWTDSREFKINETIPRLNPIVRPIMAMYGDYRFYKHNKNALHSWTYTYIREKNLISFVGSLIEKTGYTLFQYDKKEKNLVIVKDSVDLVVNKPRILFDIFIAQGEEHDIFDKYFSTGNYSAPRVEPCTGWTSWYNYYTKVTEKDILENLEAFSSRKLPIDIFQIDDGYQHAVGDWLNINEKFPNGMKALADKIRANGYKAGLWLAPIVCEKNSDIYKKHPEWVVAKAGYNPGWSGNFYTLDFYNEEVRQYLREVFDTVLNKWNYDLVKLDFLYAVALIKRDDKTRGEIMYEFMEFLREIVGDKLILGCGVPLGPAFGLVDYCRVSSDVDLTWENKFGSTMNYRERVSTINALTSTIGRQHLDKRVFLNDPDVFILRSENNSLTEDQKYTLFLLNILLGSLTFTSDNINSYSKKQMEIFKIMLKWKNKKINSVSQGEVVRVDFEVEDVKYVSFSNLTSNRGTIVLDSSGSIVENGQVVGKGGALTLLPYQSLCLKKS